MELSTLWILPTRDKRQQALDLLHSVQGPTQAEPHCLACRVYEEHGSDESILFFECWDSKEGLERHIRSDMYHRVLEAMELSQVPPDLKFYHVAQTRGMSLVEALRSGVPEPAGN